MIEDKINSEIHCWNCLLSILCSFWNETDFPLWVSKFQAQGTRWHCLSCFDILFSQSRSNSEASVHKLQSGSSGTLGSPPLFSPLHILCFPKALLIWILDVIKKSSWKHPIHPKFRFIWIFSHETLVECMTRDPKECKAFKLYIQALRSLADRWHTATRLVQGKGKRSFGRSHSRSRPDWKASWLALQAPNLLQFISIDQHCRPFLWKS